MKAIPETCCAY